MPEEEEAVEEKAGEEEGPVEGDAPAVPLVASALELPYAAVVLT